MNMHLPDALTIRDMFLGNLDLQLTVDFCLRLLLSCVCGGAIGIERSKHFKEAGVRTHVIVCMGAALAMIVSKYGFADLAMDNGSFFPGTKEADPARVAAQGISGISFLGAGVIFKREGLVRGLTTAAGIWVTAAIGLAVGSGMLVIGLFAALVVCILNALSIRRYIFYQQEYRKTFIVPALSSIIMAFGAYAIWYVLHLVFGNSIATILAIIFGVVIYLISMVAFRGLTEDELKKVPKGDLLISVFHKMGLLR